MTSSGQTTGPTGQNVNLPDLGVTPGFIPGRGWIYLEMLHDIRKVQLAHSTSTGSSETSKAETVGFDRWPKR